MAVVKDVQRNPVKRIVEHVDFYEVKAGEKIDVEVPVFVEGTPKGAAVAFVDIQELKVRADVANLPEKIVVNVDGLTDGSKVFAKDVVLPEGVVLDVEDPEESVVTVEVPEDAHRLRPLRLLTPLPLRLLTLSEPYRFDTDSRHRGAAAVENGAGFFVFHHVNSATRVTHGCAEVCNRARATSAQTHPIRWPPFGPPKSRRSKVMTEKMHHDPAELDKLAESSPYCRTTTRHPMRSVSRTHRQAGFRPGVLRQHDPHDLDQG